MSFMTFDTGTWGDVVDTSESAAEKRRREKEEREAELARIREDEERKERERQKEEQRRLRDLDRQLAEQEKENRREEERLRREEEKQAEAQSQEQRELAEQIQAAKKVRVQAARSKKAGRSSALRNAGRSAMTSSNRSSSSSSTSSSSTRQKRGKVRVNPVTGALEAVADHGDDGKVTEGCMRIDKKYMQAAVAAGLGAGRGMYGHIGVLNRELQGSHNTGGRPQDGPRAGREAAGAALRRGKNSGSMSTVKVERVGGVAVHSIASRTSNPRRKKLVKNKNFFKNKPVGSCDLGGNPIRGDQKRPPKGNKIRTGVQGKTRSISTKASRGRTSSSSYMKQKGVVATLGGATSSASQRLADKRANAAAQETQQARLASRPKPRRAAVSKKLGGASAPAASDREAMRAARLAALERRGL